MATLHRILAVDDEATVRALIARVLQRAGHTVEVAGTAEEALELLSRQPFDLMIIDKNLPRMSGLECVRRARETLPQLPVVLTTAEGEGAPVGDQRLEAYLPKPFPSLKAIEESVAAAFAAHAAFLELQRIKG